MSKRYTGYEALAASASTKCREVLSMRFTPCWQYIPRPLGVQLSHQLAMIKRRFIEVSSSKPYLFAQYPGQNLMLAGPRALSFSHPLLMTAELASAKVLNSVFRLECNAVFLRCSITAFAEYMTYMPTHRSPTCAANSLVPEDIASNPVCPR